VKQSPGFISPSSELPVRQSSRHEKGVKCKLAIMKDPWGLMKVPAYPMTSELLVDAELVSLCECPGR
jgi:hypothetical protein